MTVDKVVDASAIAAVAFDEPTRATIESRLASAVCYAPEFIDVELASTCLKKIRLGIYSRDVLPSMYRAFGRVPINRVKVDLPAAIILAEQKNLSLYDASYLWLAQSRGVELVTLVTLDTLDTLDTRLAKAALP